MFNYIKDDERGISVAEVLVAAAIFLLVIGAIYSLFISGYDTFNYSDRQIEAQQNVRAAMIQMAKEIRNSYEILGPAPDTSSNNLSLRGLQIMDETLTQVDINTVQAEKKPWLKEAQPVVYRKQFDGSFQPLIQYTVNWEEGRVSNFSTDLSPEDGIPDEIKADYTYDVKITYTYRVEAGEGILERVVKRTDTGSLIEEKTIARYIVNDLSKPEEAVFTRQQDNLVKIKLIVDRYPDKPPARYVLESSVKARK